MGTPRRDLTSSFLYLFSALAIVYVNGDCSYSNCATNMYSYYSYYLYNLIPFPFRTPDQPPSCGLPGFDLLCHKPTRTPLLSFPSGQSFTVDSITNTTRVIRISGGGCFPEKLLNLNYSGTPFSPREWTIFTLYSCPLTVNLEYPLSSSCSEIGCVDKRRNNPVVCDAYMNASGLLGYGCSLTGNVRVAGRWSYAYSFRLASSVHLTWDTPRECRHCESMGMVCRRDPQNYNQIKCFPRPRLYNPSQDGEAGVTPTVLILVAIPIMAMVLICSCYICCKMQRSNRHAHAALGQSHVNATSNQRSNVTSGVEQATLDMYPTIVVGDSGRILTNMEDTTCPICLSDYVPGEILKLLPECLHKFHSDCIDEWLRAKPLCPVCRTLPPLTSS